jgi:ABC-type antimicrobial peptide transport system permease subunit
MIHLFLKECKSHWLELILASLVISLGVSLVIIQRTLAEDSEKAIHEHAHKLGNNMLLIPGDLNLSDFYRFKYGEAILSEDSKQKISSSEIGRHIGIYQGRLYGNLDTAGVSLVVAGMDIPAFNRRSSNGSAELVFIGRETAGNLNLKPGDLFSLNNVPLKVSRILDSPPDGLDMGVFTSLAAAQKILGKPGSMNAMYLGGCWCRLNIPELAAKVENILPGTRAITRAGMIKAQKGMLATMSRYTALFYTVSLLLVGGAVLFMILIQIQRYIREFGLLLAVGTPPHMVIIMFMVKAGLTGTLGALLGFLISRPLTAQMSALLLGVRLEPSSGLFLPVASVCISISVITALLVSLRLVYLDPTRVLSEV